jgi:hypothetical protein
MFNVDKFMEIRTLLMEVHQLKRAIDKRKERTRKQTMVQVLQKAYSTFPFVL